MLTQARRTAVLAALAVIMWNPPMFGRPPKTTGTADVVFVHGNIVTGQDLTSSAPKRVSALAIQGGLVMAVGSDKEILNLSRRSSPVWFARSESRIW